MATRARLGVRAGATLAVAAVLGCSRADRAAGVPGADAGARDAAPPADRTDADAGAGGPDARTRPVDECNPVHQTGCREPKPWCNVQGNRAVCTEAGNGRVAAGGVCPDPRDCRQGFQCVVVGTATVSRCLKLCERADPCAGCADLAPGGEWGCNLEFREAPDLGACVRFTPRCDALAQNCAGGEAQNCAPFPTCVDRYDLRCLPAGPGRQDAACGRGQPLCARGYLCVADTPNGPSGCRRLCSGDGAPADCSDAQGTTCSGSVNNYPSLRYCRPP